MSTQKNKKSQSQRVTSSHNKGRGMATGYANLGKGLLVSCIFIAVLWLTFLIVHPLFDQVQGSLVGVAAVAWLIATPASVLGLLSGILIFSDKENRAERAKRVEKTLLMAILIAGGVVLLWAILCTYLAAKQTVNMSTQYWMAVLVPVGVIGWLGSYVFSFLKKKQIGMIDIFSGLFLGILASGGAVFIVANALLALAFWFYAIF